MVETKNKDELVARMVKLTKSMVTKNAIGESEIKELLDKIEERKIDISTLSDRSDTELTRLIHEHDEDMTWELSVS